MTHKEIINNLLNKKIAIFAGAGISYASGLPTVEAFYENFLPKFYDENDADYLKKLIKHGNIPFERVMEHIFSYTGNDSIMDMFANGEPNTLHNILAQMISNGWAAELYTTNFDCLIEQAFEANGLMKKHYGYFYDEKGFAKLSKSTYSKNVIKIHGTIDNKESIRTTLETITSNDNLTKRKPPVERLFSNGSHDVVLVLGYSFSDKFDINEFIKKLNINKTVIIISHKNGQIESNDIQSLADKKNDDIFGGKNIDGWTINIDTLYFMSELCKTKYDYIPSANPKIFDFGKYLENWVSKFDDVHKKFIAGGICNAMNEFDRGYKYIAQAFNLGPALKMLAPNRIDLYISIINNYVLPKLRVRESQKECEDLVLLCKETIELLKSNKHYFSENLYKKRLVDLTYRLGRIYEDGYFDYKEAIRHYFSVYRIDYRTDDILGMSQTIHQIGYAYSSLGNLTLAIKCFKKSIKLKKRCGYISGITRTYYAIAAETLRNSNKKLKQVEYYLRKANESVRNVGETELICYINNLQSIVYMKKEAWNDAENILIENISKLKNQQRTTALSNANYNLARCKIRLKKHDSAIELLENNLQIVYNLGDKRLVFNHNQELAIAHLLLGNNENCYQYFSNNVKSLFDTDIVAKGHFFFYLALYYKKYNLTKHYKSFLDVSKQCFQAGKIVNDFYSLKRDFDNEVMPDKTLVFDKDKHILLKEFTS
ncbi:MAG: SIR2 family protein [Treponema sp.]|nr:SIR2 family protein [Treponema sp.]